MPVRGEAPSTLLRAKPSKDGDAELRDYGDASRKVRRAASDSRSCRDVGGRFVRVGVDTQQFGRAPPSSRGSATKAKPAKAGDAKPRGYRTPPACHASRVAEPHLGEGHAFSECCGAWRPVTQRGV